ncbi:zinc ribbon domain-containing protein [Haladaptatus sp. SPP-AMP-3]|uniref:DUF7575 domain-containing protein n=1 Tax=Haladaptatus sp. SPP-AMP-3 TaxID=3121295 RepID=UPI003C2BD116
MNTTTRKRPWFAALLSSLVVGLGHFYLRRWKRALAWITILAGVVLLSDPHAVTTYRNLSDPHVLTPQIDGTDNLWGTVPIFVISFLAAVDAYTIAYVQNQELATPVETDDRDQCPYCGHDIDPSLEFCHWCTTELEQMNDTDGRENRR